MLTRRTFLGKSLLASLGLLAAPQTACENTESTTTAPTPSLPLLIATWNHGLQANQAGFEALQKGKSALDAVEVGVKVVEADPKITTVGLGGMPDRDGKVTLDACIMDHEGNCGSVCFLEDMLHPISVARKVMEETPHVMFAGAGALQFAVEQGFERVDLLTPGAKAAWEKWLKEKKYEPAINVENHDTIGMLALDEQQRLAGACTTSGLGFKMRGRVGDSPIIGAGLYVDGEVGAAVATGLGEMIMKTLGAFLVVEMMRQGASPQEACEGAVMRLAKKVKGYQDAQACFIAVDKTGKHGAYAIHPGFSYALMKEGKNEVIKSKSLLNE